MFIESSSREILQPRRGGMIGPVLHKSIYMPLLMELGSATDAPDCIHDAPNGACAQNAADHATGNGEDPFFTDKNSGAGRITL